MAKTTTTNSAPVTEAMVADWAVPRMYVGPSLPRFGVVQNVVYTNYPEAFAEAAKTTPRIKQLFINILSYPAAEKSIREQKGYIWEAYKVIQALGGEA